MTLMEWLYRYSPFVWTAPPQPTPAPKPEAPYTPPEAATPFNNDRDALRILTRARHEIYLDGCLYLPEDRFLQDALRYIEKRMESDFRKAIGEGVDQ